ncbi:hypothetical protein [Sphaerisporangium fuscum]|uniref:hypothetical protein n=1 Tax=Sphaerisporangium fuscum TaxID=2835868 RepID=UPI001BDD6003|nr:hypothetical protein [Sphaerisporangium fuscum]
MGLEHGKPLRDACWNSLSGRVRQRLLELSGQVLGWFATTDPADPDNRSRAVVFGEHGLSIAEPRLNTEHRPVYAISAYLFDPVSFRRMHIEHRPHLNQMSHNIQQRSSLSCDYGISESVRGKLGNLPPGAQELLQAPFIESQGIKDHDWYYEGYDNNLDPFMLYLAGHHDVTMAIGRRMIPAGHSPSTAHWSLICYRASVTRRIGR